MSVTLIWLLAVGMGVYQGLNPPIGWLLAVGRGLEKRSLRALFASTWALAFGHFLSMIVLLVPIAVLIAVLVSQQIYPVDLMQMAWFLSLTLIGFGIYKILRPQHPKFIVRIRPDQPVRWSFFMGLTHCGSPVMMVPMLINLSMVSTWLVIFGASTTGHLLGYIVLALGFSAAMAISLLVTASMVAVTVFQRLGLRGLTRCWLNLDLGWAVMFILMGIMGLTMN